MTTFGDAILEELDRRDRARALRPFTRQPAPEIADLRFQLWLPVSEEQREDAKKRGQTPEDYPENFFPEAQCLNAEDNKKVNLSVDSYLLRGGKLPAPINLNRTDGTNRWVDKCVVTKYGLEATEKEILQALTAPTAGGAEAVMIRADEIVSKKIEWLWEDRIAIGKLSVLAGHPGQGKSLASLYLASRVSRGFPLFGAMQVPVASDVLIMSAEDDLDDMVRPRLEAAEADLARIRLLKSIRFNQGPGKDALEREAQLDTDLQVIENTLARNPNIRLLIIDPISSFLGNANMNKEQDVRRVLLPLKGLAERRRVAVVSVMHLNKTGDQSAIHRIGGAVAFTGVARSVWYFGEEEKPEAPMKDEAASTEPPLKQMLSVKNNLSRSYNDGLSYKIASRPVLIQGEKINQPCIEWVGRVNKRADDVLKPVSDKSIAEKQSRGRPKKVLDCSEWLLELLSQNGEELAIDVEKIGKRNGFSWATLRRVKDELNKKETVILVHQDNRRWYWKLVKTAAPANRADIGQNPAAQK